jgi:MPBQ/MSBQ methyltransferase
MDPEEAVARHYGNPRLERIILDQLRATGSDPDRLEPAELASVDQLHIGGTEAVEELARGAGIRSGTRVLDLGSGLGGPARLFAHRFGATVHGVDVTPSFVETAASLTRRTGLSGRVSFSTGSALRLDFAPGEFDVATLVHVGMNIEDKDTLFAQAHRVLRPGGMFAIYDIMRTGDGHITFPMPWAAHPTTSYVRTVEDYRSGLAAAGFTVVAERIRHGFAVGALQRMLERMADEGPQPLGQQLVLGADAPARLANLFHAVQRGVLAPVEIFATRGHD